MMDELYLYQHGIQHTNWYRCATAGVCYFYGEYPFALYIISVIEFSCKSSFNTYYFKSKHYVTYSFISFEVVVKAEITTVTNDNER